jgi:hypothetical protein
MSEQEKLINKINEIILFSSMKAKHSHQLLDMVLYHLLLHIDENFLLIPQKEGNTPFDDIGGELHKIYAKRWEGLKQEGQAATYGKDH